MLQALLQVTGVPLVLLHGDVLHLSDLGTLQGLVLLAIQGERRPVIGGLKLVPGHGVGDADVGVHGDIGRLPLDPDLDKGFFRSLM